MRQAPDTPEGNTRRSAVSRGVVGSTAKPLYELLLSIPGVGNENRNALVELVRQEANEYLDQELIESPLEQSLCD